MKKFVPAFIAVLLLLLPLEAPAFHIVGEQIKTKFSIQNDFVDPENGESFTKQKVIAYFQKGDAGIGGEVFMIPKKDYLRFRPYATLKLGPVTPIIGLSTDSKGVDHIDAGLWYFRKFGNLGVFIDLRNYWGLNSDSVDFTDNFAALSLNVNEKFFVGVDISYDHYWKNKDDWYLVGIPIGYKAVKNVDVFIRPTYEEFIPEGGKKSGIRSLRMGVNISF